MKSPSLTRVSIGAGLTAPIVLALVVVFASSIQPNYEHGRYAISSLGSSGAQYPWAMNVIGFGLTGLLVCLFSIAFIRTTGLGPSSLIATCSWLIVGMSQVCLGIWRYPDPYHLEFVFYASLFSVIGIVSGSTAIASSLRSPWLWPTALVGVVAIASYVGVLTLGAEYFGILQRVHVGGVGIWIELAALHLLALEMM